MRIRKTTLIFALGVVIYWAVALRSPQTINSRIAQAQIDIETIYTTVVDYDNEYGKNLLSHDLYDVTRTKFDVGDQGTLLLDPWGHEYVVCGCFSNLVVKSAGPDGFYDTPDDLVKGREMIIRSSRPDKRGVPSQ